jgi:hypothetical protein
MINDPVALVLSRLENVKKTGAGYTARCPAHDDCHSSLKIDTGDRGQALIYCHAGCVTSAVVAALDMTLADLYPPKSAIVNHNGHGRRIVATYDYRDEAGTLLYQVLRYEPKDFRQRRPDGRCGWVWNLDGVRRVLYRLPELLATDPAGWVLIPEGERDVARLVEFGYVATTSAQGAGKWRPEYAKALRGRRIVVLSDNDEPGERHAEAVERSLVGVAAEVRVLRLPELPPKGDVSDWLDAGGTVEGLQGLIEATPTSGATAVTTELLRNEGSAILDDVETFLRTYVAYPSAHTRVAHALWIAHTHAMDAWDSTPRIAFLSPEPASGKSRALEVTELLVPRPVEAINVTAHYLFRKVDDEDGAPAVLFDEIDTVFGPKARDHEDVRGLLNAGHRKGAVAGRCVVRGKTVETVEYPAYCAVAMAGLGDLPDTILTRSVVVRMRRRAPNERVQPFRRRVALPIGHAFRDRLAAWMRRAGTTIGDPWPEMPAGVEDRDADVWEALLAVADAAGGEWPERARTAAVVLVAESKESTPSLGIRLLADLRTVFRDRDTMTTDAVLMALHELPEAPWAEIVAGKPLNARGLSKRLSGYGIKPRTIRIGDKTPRGYAREDLADTWSRYLPDVVHVSDVSDSMGDEDNVETDTAGATADTPSTAGPNLSLPVDVIEDHGCLPLSPKENETSETGATLLSIDCSKPAICDKLGRVLPGSKQASAYSRPPRRG